MKMTIKREFIIGQIGELHVKCHYWTDTDWRIFKVKIKNSIIPTPQAVFIYYWTDTDIIY